MKAERIVPLFTTVFVLATAMAVLFVNPTVAREASISSSLPGTAHHAVAMVAENLQAY